MNTVRITQEEFESLKDFVVRIREWPAVFICNQHGRIWPWKRYGLHPERDRIYVEGQHPLLDYLVDIFLAERPLGGRFFLSEEGLFYKEGEVPAQEFQVVKFVISTGKRAKVKS